MRFRSLRCPGNTFLPKRVDLPISHSTPTPIFGHAKIFLRFGRAGPKGRCSCLGVFREGELGLENKESVQDICEPYWHTQYGLARPAQITGASVKTYIYRAPIQSHSLFSFLTQSHSLTVTSTHTSHQLKCSSLPPSSLPPPPLLPLPRPTVPLVPPLLPVALLPVTALPLVTPPPATLPPTPPLTTRTVPLTPLPTLALLVPPLPVPLPLSSKRVQFCHLLKKLQGPLWIQHH